MKTYFYFAIGLIGPLGIMLAQSDPTKIRSVTINGNESIAQKELTGLLRQKPSSWLFRGAKLEPRLVKLDALTLKNYFHSQGFLDAIIKGSYQIENDFADLFFNIVEGKRFFVSNVNIHGNKLISNNELKSMLGITVNQPYNPVRINENFTLLENRYHEFGKLFVKLKIQDEVSDSVAISIIIDEGPDVVIHRTFIDEEGVDSVQVFRELKYNRGDVYSLSKMDLTKRRLRETGIFSMVNLIPVKVADSDSLVNIVIELNRFKQREWVSVGGYEPVEFYEGTEPLPAIGGFIEWRNRSIYNSTTNFSTKLMVGIPWETKFNKPRFRYDITVFNNWLFLIRWPTKVTGFYEALVNYQEERNNFPRIERYGLEISQQVNLDERSFFGNNAVWEYFSDQEDSLQKLQQRSISMRFHFDRKDVHLNPRSGYLFDIYPKETEGVLDKRLAKLVNRKTCASIGWSIGIKDFIIMGDTKKKINQKDEKILSDACEALIGAIYADRGYNYAKEFVLRFWKKDINESHVTILDPKTKLQEYSLKLYKKLPFYRLLNSKGPKHNPIFKISVAVNKSKQFIGLGNSKKQAEQDAAAKLLKSIN